MSGEAEFLAAVVIFENTSGEAAGLVERHAHALGYSGGV